jgi:hypothetical protein
LISQKGDLALHGFGLLWIGFLNLFAILLILDRSAVYAGRTIRQQRPPVKPAIEQGMQEQAKGLIFKLERCVKHLPFVILEFSGALFYILLIVTSFIGVVRSECGHLTFFNSMLTK